MRVAHLALGIVVVTAAIAARQRPILSAQSSHTVIIVAAGARVKSDSVRLTDNEGLDVRTLPAQATGVQLYVHDADDILVSRSEPGASTLSWRPAIGGQYHVIVDNAGREAVSVELSSRAATGMPRGGSATGFATVRVNFATNRQQIGNVPARFFGTDPTSELSYGYGEVTIPREHRLGELEGPSIWRLEIRANPENHVVLTAVRLSSRIGFLDEVRGGVRRSREKQILLFIHGFNVSFEDAMRRAGQLAYDLAFDGPTIVFTWPSQGSPLPFAYTHDQRNADLSVAPLRSILRDLASAAGGASIHVIAHSMGNKVLANALSELSTATPPLPRLGEVALLAPDIDAELFRQSSGKLAAQAAHTTLYASAKDGALLVAQEVAGYKRAGQAADGMILPGIETIDATEVDTSLLAVNHSYFADNTTILSDIYSLLKGRRPTERFNLLPITVPAGLYWRFRPAAR